MAKFGKFTYIFCKIPINDMTKNCKKLCDNDIVLQFFSISGMGI